MQTVPLITKYAYFSYYILMGKSEVIDSQTTYDAPV